MPGTATVKAGTKTAPAFGNFSENNQALLVPPTSATTATAAITAAATAIATTAAII